MILPIVGLYDSSQRAAEAVAALRHHGFFNDDISVIGPSTTHQGGSSEDPVADAIAAAYVLKREAKVYAQGVRKGGTLVVVRAPFGRGGMATMLLNNAGPIDSGVETVSDRPTAYDPDAPLSSAFRLPVKVSCATPISAFLVLPVITRSRTLCSLLGLPELADSKLWLFGEPALSGNPTPLSSKLGLPLLKG
jgi:hypothetical protein